MNEATVRLSLSLPRDLWARLDRFRQREGISPEEAMSKALRAGYAVWKAREDGPTPGPVTPPGRLISRSAAAFLALTWGLEALGVPEHPVNNGA
jgi:hypothetical protein